MTEWIPCPACGTENGPEAGSCEICGFALGEAESATPLKCARCGSQLGVGFEFCQICGLRVQSRLPRPSTQKIKLVPRRGSESAVAAEASGEVNEVKGMGLPESAAGELPEQSPGVWGSANTATPKAPGSDPVVASESGAEASGQGETGRMAEESKPAAVKEPAAAGGGESVAGNGTSWSPPMARLAVESSRRSAGTAPLRVVQVQRDGSEGDSVMLRGPIVIGRRYGELQFPRDVFISPTHARLELVPGGGIRLIDLGTRNGIFVRISRPEPVFPGDLFLIGHHLLRLENVPPAGREQEVDGDGVRLFGTPQQVAWGRLMVIGVGGAEAEVYCLRAPQIMFGRELGDIIFPSDPFASWQHAQLAMELQGETMTVHLTDLRSANGTYLRIRGDVILQPGDMFRVGDQIFRVRMN